MCELTDEEYFSIYGQPVFYDDIALYREEVMINQEEQKKVIKRVVYWRFGVEHSTMPRGYGLAYSDYSRSLDVLYPIPLNYIVRYGRALYRVFFGMFYWVGLIDVGLGESFRWRDFYRIKVH